MFHVLQKTALFKDVSPGDLKIMLGCLNGITRTFKRSNYIIRADDPINLVGIILSGKAQIIKQGITGTDTIIAELGAGDVFGESYVCAGINKSPVSIYTLMETQVYFLDYKRIITVCSSACVHHMKLIENMLKLIAHKNISLNKKLEFISKRTIRERILSYLEFHAQKTPNGYFTIPYNRTQLADYLCADRSALTRELYKLQEEGLVEFEKNKFRLLYFSES